MCLTLLAGSTISCFFYLLYTQILTNVLRIPTTVMLPWPLVKIRLGLSSATVFKGIQETGSCVQVTLIFI